jgi:hypothetical protein
MRAATAIALLLLLAACKGGVSEDTKKAAENVLTLRTNAVSELHERYGTGPFRDYAVPPREMLDLVTAALKTFVPAVFENERTFSVVAKERSGKDAWVDDYSPEWDSAVIVFVHRVTGRPDACRVEVHSTNRGVFTKGRIPWEQVLPARLDEAVAKRGRTPIRPLGGAAR